MFTDAEVYMKKKEKEKNKVNKYTQAYKVITSKNEVTYTWPIPSLFVIVIFTREK